MSGSGPFGPIVNGVWQSLHPMTVTRYLPRATEAADACGDTLEASVFPPQAIASRAAARVRNVRVSFIGGLLLECDVVGNVAIECRDSREAAFLNPA